MDSMAWSKGLDVEVGGHGVVIPCRVGHSDRVLADRTGLTGARWLRWRGRILCRCMTGAGC